MNVKMGDINQNLVQDRFRCQHWSSPDLRHKQELFELMESYLKYTSENWAALESGTYKLLTKRPKVTHGQLLTEEIVVAN